MARFIFVFPKLSYDFIFIFSLICWYIHISYLKDTYFTIVLLMSYEIYFLNQKFVKVLQCYMTGE